MNKNLISGIFLSLLGLISVIYSAQYEFGNLKNIGPGFFPSLVGFFLFVFGFIILLSSLKKQDTLTLDVKPLFFIISGILVFSLVLTSFGLIMSILSLVIIMSFLTKTTVTEKAGLLLGLSAFNYFLFVWFLNIPIKFW